MLRAALIFFALAVISYILGVTGVAGLSLDTARVLLVIFLVFAVIGVAIGLITDGGRPKDVL